MCRPAPGRSSRSAQLLALGVWAALAAATCTNNPYPDQQSGRKIVYDRFDEAPKTLDPQVSYTTAEHAVLGNIYEGLLQYDYLRRPYTLIPALAEERPEPQTDGQGRVHYRFQIRPDARYHPDPCFGAYGGSGEARSVVAQDFAFAFERTADPGVGSPMLSTFSKLVGFQEFGEKLARLRKEDPAFARLRPDEQYARAGGIEGVAVRGELDLELILVEPYPQMLYWLALGFTAAVPWEAVAYYDGVSRPHFRDHPVGAGPYRLAEYDKQHKIVLVRHEQWYGRLHPEWKAPGTVYPGEGAPGDAERGFLDPARAGQPLPQVEQISFYRERETIPAFGKFLQGYYDRSGIIKESFDSIIVGGRLSPEMEARGVRLERSVQPAVYYLGFNMNDPVVGRGAGERGRKLRQAMSLVIDSKEFLRLFQNGRGVPAESPLPPGLFGYREGYKNPYRQVDRAKARQLLAEAGYPGGIDAATGQPLHLGIDSASTDVQTLLQYQFYVDAWRSLGIDVEIRATTYNQFQEKMRKGAQQIFRWGWSADYPDPENFLFLLESSQSRVLNDGPNDTSFADRRFDALFARMKSRPDDEERQHIIDQMLAIVEEECPWIELFYPEDYALYQPWLAPVKPFGMSYPMVKYYDVEPKQRAELRAGWNEPISWPAYALAGLGVVILIPGIRTYLRERA